MYRDLALAEPELWPKRLELLTQVTPELTRVAVLRGRFPATLELQATEVGARALGVQLQLLEARNAHRDRPGVCRGGPRGCWRTDGVWGRGLIISTSSQNR